MDYLIEAKKFIQRAQHPDNPEVTKTDLEMAERLLSREIEEREQACNSRLKDARIPGHCCSPSQRGWGEPTLAAAGPFAVHVHGRRLRSAHPSWSVGT